ncbi:hypothetical protein Thiowin_04069 [Thiorhodovibrio winogradskyi]|uniref:DUF2281 domain-containing protein n=1 Tax=Thiorhodovibrio winogradskyi TaxID=77007 RepID=A0ABZ0SEN5_9GAMM|nr:hypothetical protein [Thiorhodovibrio winogradskyi]
MTITQLQQQITQLPPDKLRYFADWFEDYLDAQWDDQIEDDARAGRLDEAGRRADADFEAGRCTPL